MRIGEIFWGILLVILGGLFLLRTAGFLSGDVFGWFWPMAVMAAGAWILLGGFRAKTSGESEHPLVIPLQGAKEAQLTINHGMGRMALLSGAQPDEFLAGIAAVGMTHSSRLVGDRLEVQIDAGPSVLPYLGPEGGAWQFRLNRDIPMTISLNAGAAELDFDLSDLHVRRFSYDGGAASLRLKPPAVMDNCLLELDAGAASLVVVVPDGVSARFRLETVGSLNVDESRFPRREDGIYQSTDYETAARRVEIVLDGGATSVNIS
jgi:hypothetical protein